MYVGTCWASVVWFFYKYGQLIVYQVCIFLLIYNIWGSHPDILKVHLNLLCYIIKLDEYVVPEQVILVATEF